MSEVTSKPALPYVTGDEYAWLRPHIKRFEQVVWFGQLFRHVNSTACRGQVGEVDGLSILIWTCAGRTLITIRDAGGDWLSLMVATDQSAKSTMGLHQRSVDDVRLIEWLYRVMHFWHGVVDSDAVSLD